MSLGEATDADHSTDARGDEQLGIDETSKHHLGLPELQLSRRQAC
jgi:hypothetical protein